MENRGEVEWLPSTCKIDRPIAIMKNDFVIVGSERPPRAF